MFLSHRSAFVMRRLHSLSGVVPVGLFLILHLWTNARALAGEDAYTHGVEEIQTIPFLPLVELLGISGREPLASRGKDLASQIRRLCCCLPPVQKMIQLTSQFDLAASQVFDLGFAVARLLCLALSFNELAHRQQLSLDRFCNWAQPRVCSFAQAL